MNLKRSPSFVLAVGLALLMSAGEAFAYPGQPAPQSVAAQAAVGTAFTYQGLLKGSGGSPVTASCDFIFKNYDDSATGNLVGASPVVTQTAVPVSQGLFTTQLDFGTGAFNGNARWLEIAVRCPTGSGSYTTLNPRQALTAAPFALALPGFYTQITTDSLNVIGGASTNSAGAGLVGVTLSGGGTTTEPNMVIGDYGTVSGGANNTAGGMGSNYDTVGGGYSNTAGAVASDYAMVGGGYNNLSSGNATTVGGGNHNIASFDNATVGGGIDNTASNNSSTVAGGHNNVASGYAATVGGGSNNTAAGETSFVAGYRAANTNAAHDGVFLFADSHGFDFPSTAANQFRVRATGGITFVTAINLSTGVPTAGVQAVSGGGSWSSLSDRNLKANFIAVDGRVVLAQVAAMPIQTWNYIAQDKAIRHIGPMAQDFYAAFNVGEDDTHITTIDADGVALAAIQGLNEVVQEKDARIAALEARVQVLEQNPGGGGATNPLTTPWPWLSLVVISGMFLLRRKAGG